MSGRTTVSPAFRVNSNRAERERVRGVFEDGNTVRVLDIFDGEEEERPVRHQKEAARSLARRRRARARARAHARTLSIGYILALTAVCIATLFLCVHYLQLRSQLINQNETIAAMETKLNRLRADNDAYENKALASVNMEEVKDTALHRLGLHYATESQIRYYNANDESYVRQYGSIRGD